MTISATKKLFLLLPLVTALMACSKENQSDEFAPDQDVDMGVSQVAVNESNANEEEVLELESDSIETAYRAFLAKGVPQVALRRTLDFYRENRASVGGLKDSSCILKPMSETGAIAQNSNRYDPSTLALLKTGIRNERYVMIVDYTKANTVKRGYLLDMQPDAGGNYTLVTMTMSHGYGSQAVNGIPTVFTNSEGHGTTVSGFFISAVKTYPYTGSASAGGYSSTGMRLYGLESTNNTAEQTSKVSHGAPYNSDTKSGNSAGCPAMTQANATKYMKQLTGGILWYHHTKINANASYKAPTCARTTLATN